jgi:hypothetical protein
MIKNEKLYIVESGDILRGTNINRNRQRVYIEENRFNREKSRKSKERIIEYYERRGIKNDIDKLIEKVIRGGEEIREGIRRLYKEYNEEKLKDVNEKINKYKKEISEYKIEDIGDEEIIMKIEIEGDKYVELTINYKDIIENKRKIYVNNQIKEEMEDIIDEIGRIIKKKKEDGEEEVIINIENVWTSGINFRPIDHIEKIKAIEGCERVVVDYGMYYKEMKIKIEK